MRFYNFLHVAVAVTNGDLHRAIAVPLVQEVRNVLSLFLPLGEAIRIVITDDVVELCQLLRAFHAAQVEESFISFRVSRGFRRRQEAVPLHGHKAGVLHLILGRAGMNVHAVNRHFHGSRIEVLILQFADFAAIHRVAILCAEGSNIKEISAPANLFIRREGNANRAMLRRILTAEQFRKGHDFRHACLVIAAQHAVAAGDNQFVALQILQKIKAVNHHTVFQGDGLAIVAVNHLRMGRSHNSVRSIHVGDQPHLCRVISLGRDGAVHIAVLIYPGILNAHGLHFLHQHVGQRPLTGSAGAGVAVRVRGGFYLYILEEAFLYRHVYHSYYNKVSSAIRLSSL